MCTQPITKKINSSKYAGVYSTLIPCGKCLECLRDLQNAWVVRLFMESKYHSNVLFFTLTYAPDVVPELVDSDGVVYRTVFKKHVQDWFKRFRIRYYKEFGKNAELKYFITSEYGPQTKRPHYHGIVFGVPKDVFNRLALADWRVNFGYVDLQEVRLTGPDLDKSLSGVMRYVGKYCVKGEFENPFVEEKKVLPSFRLISKGIGKQYTLDIKDFVLFGTGPKRIDYTPDGLDAIIERSKIKIGNCYYSLPQFCKNIIYGEQTLLSYKIGQILLSRTDDVYRSQLQQVQTDWNCTDIQAHRIISLQQSSTKELAEENLRQKFEQIYLKSKL